MLWKVDLGAGFGAAAIKDGKAFVLDRIAGRADVLRCLDLATGKELWSYGYPAPGKVSFDGSRSVPSVDDKYVFTVGCFGQVNCISRTTHKPVWSKNLLKDFGPASAAEVGLFPVAAAVQGHGDPRPADASKGIVALDKATGKEIWASGPVGAAHYVSPEIITIDGVDQVTIVNADGASAVDANTGKKLWNFSGWTCKISIPNVTSIGDGRVLITGGYKAGTVMIKVTRSGDAWKTEQLWRNDNISSQMNPAILYKGHLYINGNSNETSDGLMCVDLDGKILWKTGDKPNFQRGHMLLADGILYIIDGKTGILHLVELSPAGYKEVGKAAGLLSGKNIWAPLSPCGTKLVIRDQSKMLCIDLAQGK